MTATVEGHTYLVAPFNNLGDECTCHLLRPWADLSTIWHSVFHAELSSPVPNLVHPQVYSFLYYAAGFKTIADVMASH